MFFDNVNKLSTYFFDRSVYLPVARQAMPAMLKVFDVADPSLVVGERDVTTVPTQALFMMNSPFVEERAAGFAGRLLADAQRPRKRVHLAFLRAYGRAPSAVEISDSLAFLDQMGAEASAESPELFAWTRLCHVILSASEFIYID